MKKFLPILMALCMLSVSARSEEWAKKIPQNRKFIAQYYIKGCAVFVAKDNYIIVSAIDNNVEEIIKIKKDECGKICYGITHHALPPVEYDGTKIFRTLNLKNKNIFGEKFAEKAQLLPPEIKTLFFGYCGIN